jgi:RsiW-degrading membrane proteinase PrsW (M82 family)
LLRGQLHVAFLAAVGGLSFALVESLVYIFVYFPGHSNEFVIYRFTVTPAIHMLASFTVGLGINRGVLDWAWRGTPPPRSSIVFFATGVGIHAAYNTTVVVLSLTNFFDF